MTQENREIVAHVNPNMGMVVTRIRDFTRMNPPEFHGSKVDEDPPAFIGEEKFNGAFLDHLFPLEMGEAKVLEFSNPRQGSMSVKEYSLKFTQLANDTLTMVVDSRKKFSGQGTSNAPTSNFNKNIMSNPKPQGGGCNGSSISICQRCGKSHSRKCLAGSTGCFGCVKNGHKVKDYPLKASKGKDTRQAQPSGFGSGAPYQNKLYALQTR
ncbi:hypothetical protein MTR67_007619 [Solanum verrucosum]|uniref:Gag-pol polyprotein n=1 Tax=Solanum verrucosum TaxID=315347 RepID=A0AAF0PZZ3_SOLVR|nr:hypothetical protein MTR67_007619 [Solanum verrucosum]